jgi:probable RNA-binding protein EIF1AD
MSAATKRKHVVKEVLDDFVLPEGSQQIVRVSQLTVYFIFKYM